MSENRRVFLNKVVLDIQTGVGLDTGQGSDPVVMFRYSADAGYTWSNEREMQIGRRGAYRTQVETWRLGYARNFVFEFSGSDPVVIGLINCYLDGSEGTA